MNKKLKIFFSTLALTVGLSATANAALINSYDFNGDLTDTLGNGLDLTASGGTVSGGRYSFAANQGLRLTSALPSTTNYGIEIRFQMNDNTAGWNKLIDFQDLAADLGLYVNNGTIDFYTAGPAGGSVVIDTDFTVAMTRSGGIIELFLDGASLFSIADGGQAVSGSNILNFFEDDSRTGQRESFVGSADFIRIHDDSTTFGAEPTTVPEPATLALMGLGLVGLGFSRKRKAA